VILGGSIPDDGLTLRDRRSTWARRTLPPICATVPVTVRAHRRVVLCAVDQVIWGASIAQERYGLADQQYREFADTYGFDVRTWPGYPVLREVRELTMTTWIMQNVGESPAAADEFALRIASLREKDFGRAWNFF
jgi:hypothetical protein